MPDYVQSPEETALREQVRKLEAACYGWRLLTIICVGLWVFFKLQPHISYDFDPYNNLVVMTKSQWFHTDKTVPVSWHKDSEGEMGWCTKDKEGHWYKFIVERWDDD